MQRILSSRAHSLLRSQVPRYHFAPAFRTKLAPVQTKAAPPLRPFMTPIVTAGAVTAGIFPLHRSIYCQSTVYSTKPTPTAKKSLAEPLPPDELLNTPTKSFSREKITFGALLGFSTGYLVKKLGKLFALFVGASFVVLQILAYHGVVNVQWGKLESLFRKRLAANEEGEVEVRSLLRRLIDLLTVNFQFKGSFVAGFYVGLRYG
ncbi:uncharacterized protein VTP21DRAFT_1809 [Calcarisporiella thermophila]|uniref:uncharacterized protein n=1 Tax=Calcarisporiella thermophila TaxID=911321 RepID=UPI0037420A67